MTGRAARSRRPAVPSATYRLQLHPGFGFRDALELLPYLDGLGVSDLYLSPVFASVPGSAHGYDVVDPTRLNPELGTEEDFGALARAARTRGMGIVLDIVPNHMSTSSHHSWWMDVLKHGRDSRYARFFDIDWDAQGGKVLVPVLGEPFGEVLESDEIEVSTEGDEPFVRYHEHTFPLAPGAPAPQRGDLDGLERLLEVQHYRLASWRVAGVEINYRRFFDISDLVSMRVEDPEVFRATHALILRLVADGAVTGLRVDHVDGLHDPTGYLERLRANAAARGAGDVFLVVEKILGAGESLPEDWPVQGTTGYEFADAAGGVLTRSDGAEEFGRIAAEFTGSRLAFHDLAAQGKWNVLSTLFGGQFAALARELYTLSGTDRRGRDLVLSELAATLAAMIARLPVYRTYTRGPRVRDPDRRFVERAVLEARRELGDAARRPLEFCRRVLLLEGPADRWLGFVMRWQSLTGPVTAKGVEDTALYRYGGLLSRAEVGGDPADAIPPARLAGFALRDIHPRHQAQRGRPGPPGRAL